MLKELREVFSTNRTKFVVEALCFLCLFLLLLSFPLFAYRTGLTVIPICLSIVMAVVTFAYALVVKRFFVPAWFVFYALFLAYCFLITAITTQAFSSIRSLFLTSAMMLTISEFLHLTKKPLIGVFEYCLAGFIFCVVLLISSIGVLPGRIGADFGDVNENALYLLSVVAAFLILERSAQVKGKWILLFVSFFAAFLCVCTGTRFVLVGLVLLYGVYLYALFKKWLVLVVYFAIIVFGLLGASYLFPSISMFGRIKDLISTLFGGQSFDGSASLRISMIKDGFALFSKNAVFGYGVSGFDTFTSYSMSHSHCNIVELLVDFGIIGTSFYFLAYYFAFRWPAYKYISLFFIVFTIPCFLFSVVIESKFFLSFFAVVSSTCVQIKP